MILAIMCWIVIAAGAAAGEDGGEVEALTVFEGENLTISSYTEKWDEDLQVLVFRLKPSQEPIARLSCHKKACKQRYWRPGVSLTSDGENVTLILTDIKYNQTGLYKVRNQINSREENRIYNLTVYKPPLNTIIPEKTSSARYSGFPAEMTAVTVSAVLMTFGIIGAIIYCKHRKTNFEKVSQDDGN